MRKYRAKFSYLPAKDKDAAAATKGKSKDDDLPELSKDLPSQDWVTEEDDFLLFWASHVSHAAENAHSSPNSELDDGIFQILIVR